MPVTYSITYDIVTPGSAEDGDVAERGFVIDGQDYEYPGLSGDAALAWRRDNDADTCVDPTPASEVPEWVTEATGFEPPDDPDTCEAELCIVHACWTVLFDRYCLDRDGGPTYYGHPDNETNRGIRDGSCRSEAVHFRGLSVGQLQMLHECIVYSLKHRNICS